MTDQTETLRAAHMPKPSDICSECGNGLVHIDPARDLATPPAAGLDEQARVLLSVLANVNVYSAEDLTRFVEYVQGEARLSPALTTPPAAEVDIELLTQACINLGYSDEGPGAQYLFAGQHRMASRLADEYEKLREVIR